MPYTVPFTRHSRRDIQSFERVLMVLAIHPTVPDILNPVSPMPPMPASPAASIHDRDWAQNLAQAVLQDVNPATLTSHALVAHFTATPSAILAIGKSAADMAVGAFAVLDPSSAANIPACIMAPPEQLSILPPRSEMLVLEGDHPESTPRNQSHAAKVLNWLHDRAAHGPLLVLLSGGASAYLISPMPGLDRADLNHLYSLIRARGGTIHDLNTIRKHCETMKGGRLAGSAPSTRVLVISDVIGDPLDVISSGPFIADATTCADALAVLTRLDLSTQFPAITHHLSNAAHETPNPGDPRFAHITHHILANNTLAMQSLEHHLTASGVRITHRIGSITGEPALAAAALAPVIQSLAIGEGVVLGGEPTVDTRSTTRTTASQTTPCRGGPQGGPSQEWCLSLAMILQQHRISGTAWALSTDGVDGNSPYAGGWLTSSMVNHARKRGAEIGAFRECHDASSFLEEAAGEIFTGPTGVNVNHVACVVRTA